MICNSGFFAALLMMRTRFRTERAPIRERFAQETATREEYERGPDQEFAQHNHQHRHSQQFRIGEACLGAPIVTKHNLAQRKTESEQPASDHRRKRRKQHRHHDKCQIIDEDNSHHRPALFQIPPVDEQACKNHDAGQGDHSTNGNALPCTLAPEFSTTRVTRSLRKS